MIFMNIFVSKDYQKTLYVMHKNSGLLQKDLNSREISENFRHIVSNILLVYCVTKVKDFVTSPFTSR